MAHMNDLDIRIRPILVNGECVFACSRIRIAVIKDGVILLCKDYWKVINSEVIGINDVGGMSTLNVHKNQANIEQYALELAEVALETLKELEMKLYSWETEVILKHISQDNHPSELDTFRQHNPPTHPG